MPNRFLKESIRTSKSINTLNDFQFRVWAYLITYVDDFGRGSAEPDILKGFVFPRRKSVTEASIKSALDDLEHMGLIRLYDVDGDSYLYFPNWASHQNVRAASSKFPEPTEENIRKHPYTDDSSRIQPLTDVPASRISVLDTRNSNLDTRTSPRQGAECARFDDFWAVYPNKVKKKDALTAWRSAKLDKIADTIIADVQRRCSTEWKGQDMHYVPHPTTYLHQRRWEDETAPTERKDSVSAASQPNPALNFEQREYKDEDFGDDFFIDLDKYGEG